MKKTKIYLILFVILAVILIGLFIYLKTIQALTLPELLYQQKVTAISAGTGHALVIRNLGQVWSWGRNEAGQLGIGYNYKGGFSFFPEKVLTSSGLVLAKYIDAEDLSSLAVKYDDGTVWFWGYGTDDDYHNTPSRKLNLSNVNSISAGNGFNIVVKSDGTAWAWGVNTLGQLGNGAGKGEEYKYENDPVRVKDLSNVISIDSGSTYSLALTADKYIWSWGTGWFGELCTGSTTINSSPVRILGLDKINSISAGVVHSLFAKTDGSVWACGANFSGQLGNGTTTNSNVPVKVSNLSEVIAVSAGGQHSLALKSDGTVWAWGDNYYGQLGNGTTTNSSVPVKVSNLSGVIAVSAGGGDSFSLALKSDGTVWAWGRNVFGQLGIGSFDYDAHPIPVKVNFSPRFSLFKNISNFLANIYESLRLK